MGNIFLRDRTIKLKLRMKLQINISLRNIQGNIIEFLSHVFLKYI